MAALGVNASSISHRSDPEPIPLNIPQLIGPRFVGILMNWGLLGVLSMQIYIYHACFPKDSRTIKILVYGLYILDIAQTAMATSDGFDLYASGWGNVEILDYPLLGPWDCPLLDSIVALVVQVFFSWRIYVLGKNAFFSILLLIIALASAGGGLATAARSKQLDHVSLSRQYLGRELGAWLGAGALVDTLIAISMTYILLRHKNHIKRTNRVITRIITLTIETNTLTAGVATLTFILFYACPDANYFICPPYILGKLYSNTLLAVFNNRIVLRNEAGTDVVSSGAAMTPMRTTVLVFADGSRTGDEHSQREVRSNGIPDSISAGYSERDLA